MSNNATEYELESAIEKMYMVQESIQEGINILQECMKIFDRIDNCKYSSSMIDAYIVGILQNTLESGTGDTVNVGELIELLEEEFNNFVYME